MWSLLVSAVLLGLVSSAHCVGMCGPLALSLPLSSQSVGGRRRALMMYHAGRVSVYGVLGGIFGVLGRHIYLAGFQRGLSIVLGVVILLSAMPWVRRLTWIDKMKRPLNELIFALWGMKGKFRYFILGMANGLLPCGMVYLAIAGALSFSQVWQSIVFMIFFGAGTLPALLLLSVSGRLAGVRTRVFIRRAMPGVVALMGLLLIFRGLDLGIPFLSPSLAADPGHPISCH